MGAVDAEVSELLGKTLVEVTQQGDDVLFFVTECGKEYRMYHYQNCCEDVHINDICGDLSDLIGHPLLMAEEVAESERRIRSILTNQRARSDCNDANIRLLLKRKTLRNRRSCLYERSIP
ncbi:DUF7448 domain-containing protein [Bacillus pumilus]|jgi:hypothetical protein|uniref:DUF7448 domain-containing protein n=1 Tax=Bacillus pumilus TaxID=1408 RepID=UPI00081FAB8D|nr:hypothetical protein BEN31_00125 [Bacillus pumilus]